MNRGTLAYAVLSALALAGCATAPVGPNVVVMPAPNKPLEVFEQDDAYCRDYANRAISGQAQRADNAAVGKAVAGTVIGAAAGAALGGARWRGGRRWRWPGRGQRCRCRFRWFVFAATAASL